VFGRELEDRTDVTGFELPSLHRAQDEVLAVALDLV
jgi:hypothetical protein